MKKPTLQIALLIFLLAFALASQIPYSAFIWGWEVSSTTQDTFSKATYATTVQSVEPAYAASGLETGDEILRIDGAPLTGDQQFSEWLTRAKPNQTVTVDVTRVRDGKLEAHTIRLRMAPARPQASALVFHIVSLVVLPFTCLLVGFYIAFARPTDPLAWITMAMLASFSQSMGGTSVLLTDPWRPLFFIYHSVLNESWPLWMVLFALYFPIPFPFIVRKPWINWLLAIPAFVLAGVNIYCNFERVHHLRNIAWLGQLNIKAEPFIAVLFTLYVFAFFQLLVAKRKLLTQPDAKRRLRLMIFGCSAALIPTLPVIFGEIGWTPKLAPWLETICLSAVILFPVTMAYVIVVQRAMDVRMVIRSGVQYAFASTGIRVLQIGIVIAVVSGTLTYAQKTHYTVIEILILGIGIGLVLSIGRLAATVRGWMDRRFFREAYKSEVILTDLSNSVAGIRDVRILLETVTKRISESLHVPRIAVFLEREGTYRPAYALGALPDLENAEFRAQTGVANFLRRQQAPSKVFFDDPQNWVHGAPETEQEALQKLDTQVLLPLSLKSRLLGIISLGGKRSEEPYSRGDLQLLGAVASQTGLALENAELTESVRREIAQRERLDRELEIAREVQQRLFPQALPIVDGLDFAGYCRPAEGVGGDYYDFIHLPDGCLGIAVGDVSGKGIAAALMMASLQASLRGQTIKPCETLSEMIQHINRLVYEASALNRYATFFYAQYDPATMAMRYVNAGHNAPILWRGAEDQNEFVRLEDGGTVIGLFPDYPYSEGRIQLRRGDVVVAFTDGISEAMNDLDQEYGEEQLMAVVPTLRARTAAEAISQILFQVDTFTAGAKQHDDMTLVVIRVQ